MKAKIRHIKIDLQDVSPALDKVDLAKWNQACGSEVSRLTVLERDILVAIMCPANNDMHQLNFTVPLKRNIV